MVSSIRLDPGENLYLYTDGVTPRPNRSPVLSPTLRVGLSLQTCEPPRGGGL
jgi:hypothetical protein